MDLVITILGKLSYKYREVISEKHVAIKLALAPLIVKF